MWDESSGGGGSKGEETKPLLAALQSHWLLSQGAAVVGIH